MHFGAQSRGLRAPCERFAPWVTPGPRITRFRLAADLGRMGLDTHRVSNKVSKITSRHLVPLDRAFPAHAMVHGAEQVAADAKQIQDAVRRGVTAELVRDQTARGAALALQQRPEESCGSVPMGSGRPGSLLTLAPHRSGRAGSAASGSSTDSFATRRRVPAGPGSQAMATAIPTACLASSAIRCRDVETGPTLGVLAVFPSNGATCRCPLPSTGSRGRNSPVSAVSGRRRRPPKGSPPSAAQTVRAVFRHTAFTRVPVAERWKVSARSGEQDHTRRRACARGESGSPGIATAYSDGHGYAK